MSALVFASALQTGLLLSARDRASASYQSTAVDVTDYEGALAIVQTCVSATGAQTETATVQTADDAGFTANVSVVGTFTVYTQSTLQRLQRIVIDASACRQFVRINASLAGATPAISSSYTVTGARKYAP